MEPELQLSLYIGVAFYGGLTLNSAVILEPRKRVFFCPIYCLVFILSAVTLTVLAGEPSPKVATASTKASESGDPFGVESATPKIAFVFLAQTHVLPPDSKFFKLVGNREALIEVQAYSKQSTPAPEVVARLSLKGKTLELALKGPPLLPPPPKVEPQAVNHSFKDSFTAVIPKEWVMPGLALTVELRARSSQKTQSVYDQRKYDNLRVGAPTKLFMRMFDIHYFGEHSGDYPQGWLPEFQTKLPVAELELYRVRKIIFNKLVMPPRAGKPATLCGSRKEYELKTGLKFDGEQSVATSWNSAIKDAAYQRANKFGQKQFYYINIYGVPCGGVAGGFSGVGNGRDLGILLHEAGHAWGLPHWSTTNYPYYGTMHGIPGDSETTPHVGPTWAFDISKLVFLPPTVQAGAQKGTPGNYKRDPMLGGGEGDQEKPYLFRHFSDFSMSRIQTCFERILVFNDREKKYLKWNDESSAYSEIKERYNTWVPLEQNVDVVTILACASGVTDEANFVYTPIGPYKGDLIDLIEVPKDMPRASTYFNETNCNLCLRVTQAGHTRTYLVWGKISENDERLDEASLKTFAINLPARNGPVTQVDLLHAPNLFKTGNADGATVLFRWLASEHPEVALQTTEYFVNGIQAKQTTGIPAAEKPAREAAPAGALGPPAKPAVPTVQADARSGALKKPEGESKSVEVEKLRAEWHENLIKRINAAAEAKKPLKGWIKALGISGTFPLVGADEKTVKIEYQKNMMDIRWTWLSPSDQAALAKSLAKDDDVESLLMLSVFLFAGGSTAEGETALARAALLDSAAAAKIRAALK